MGKDEKQRLIELLEYLKLDQVSFLELKDFEKERDILKDSFNIRLKELEAYEELKSFSYQLEQLYGLTLVGKRSKQQAYHFTHEYESGKYFLNPKAGMDMYKNKVHYLYANGRVGSSYVKNLYKILKVV